MEVDTDSVNAFIELVRSEIPPNPMPNYDSPFNLQEIHQALELGGKNRAPGRDGLGLEYYRAARNIMGEDLRNILNTMFFDGATTTTKTGHNRLPPQARTDAHAGGLPTYNALKHRLQDSDSHTRTTSPTTHGLVP